VLTGAADNTCKIWDAQTGQLLSFFCLLLFVSSHSLGKCAVCLEAKFTNEYKSVMFA